jgi:hypothetical protein
MRVLSAPEGSLDAAPLGGQEGIHPYGFRQDG